MLTNIIVGICAAAMIGAGLFAILFLDRAGNSSDQGDKKENKKR